MQILRKPNDSHLAFLLGIAIGVMMSLSFFELWLHNCIQHGMVPVTSAVAGGALLYRLVQPLLPEVSMHVSANADKSSISRSAELLRLGLVMAVTMTLHNFPEGFAVAFSSLTDFGPTMALAIAIHNIPEGIIVAAPVYAATGSRWKALGMAALSGISEPLGALIALLSVRPIISEDALHIVLAIVGGIMGAVCVLELWSEGKKCRSDKNLSLGILFGTVIMGSTLLLGV